MTDTTTQAIYLDYDAEELGRQYDPRAFSPNGDAELKAVAAASEAARAALDCVADIAYAGHPMARLDLYAPKNAKNAPVRLFYHGGGWLRGAKEAAAFAAPAHVDAGAIFIAVGFPKLDAVSIDELVALSRDAAAWAYRHIAEYGGDPERIYVSGTSSGGHQAAMVLGADWLATGLPADTVKGATIMSASYDLAPMALTWRNDDLKLDDAGVTRLSPIHHLPVADADIVLAVAENDSPELHRQLDAYAAALGAAGKRCACLEVAGASHFSMGLAMADPATPLCRAQLTQMGLG